MWSKILDDINPCKNVIAAIERRETEENNRVSSEE